MMREEQDSKVVRQRLKKLVKREDSTSYDIVWQDYATKYGPEAWEMLTSMGLNWMDCLLGQVWPPNRPPRHNGSNVYARNPGIFQPRWDLPPRPPPRRLTAEEEEAAAVYLTVEEYLDLRPDDADINAVLRQSGNSEKAAQESMKVLRYRITEATQDCLTNLTSALGPRGWRAAKRLLTQRPASALLLDCLGRLERKYWLAETAFDRLDSDAGLESGAVLAKALRQDQVAQDPPGTLKDKLDVLNTPPGMFYGICAAIWMCRCNHVRHTGLGAIVRAGEIFTTQPTEALRFIQMRKEEQKDWLMAQECVFEGQYKEESEEEEESELENEEEEENDEGGEQAEDCLTTTSQAYNMRYESTSGRLTSDDPSGNQKIRLITHRGEVLTDRNQLTADLQYTLAEHDSAPSAREELERLLQVV